MARNTFPILALLLFTVVPSIGAFTAAPSVHATQSIASTRLAAATMEAPPQTTTTAAKSNEDIPLAPLTQWGQPYEDIVAIQQAAKKVPLPEFAKEISAKTLGIADDIEQQKNYFRENRVALLQQMQDHACVVFRDFSLMTTPEGFASFYEALEMQVCRDPLHSVAARPTVAVGNSNNSKNNQSPIYEAVNKESRKNFFIGMHNEFVGTRAPAAAAFVCFTAAETGGEFLVADGRRVFRALPTDLLRTLYDKQIRYSVMELPFFDWIDGVPEFVRAPVANAVRALVSAAVNAKVDFDVDLQWIDGSSYTASGGRTLQARAPPQPPIVAHPVTGDPTWFCNVHSHSALLRSQREAIYGAERFEDGASRINKSDMYLGDDAPLTKEQLDRLDEITTQHIQYVKMRPGDVVLLDNYKTMHGRNVFDGVRKHAVAWFEGWNGK